MEPITAGIGAAGFAVISAIGTGVTVYYKLKASFKEDLEEAIDKRVVASEAKSELRIQAIEIKHMALDRVTVKKEDVAELKSDLKNLMDRVGDLKSLLEKALRQ